MITESFPLASRDRAATTSIENPERPTLVHASVCACGTTTNYRRAGAGNLVVLLGARFLAPTAQPIIEALAARYRVIIPDLPLPMPDDRAPAAAVSGWLRSFLDGLGATELSIVASDDVALAALAFALSDEGRVRRLVLLVHELSDPVVRATPLVESECELLIVRESADGNHLSEFLRA